MSIPIGDLREEKRRGIEAMRDSLLRVTASVSDVTPLSQYVSQIWLMCDALTSRKFSPRAIRYMTGEIRRYEVGLLNALSGGRHE